MPAAAPAGSAGALERRLQAGLAALPLLVFAPALAGDRIFFYRDIVGYWSSQVAGLLRCVAETSWPLWNPLMGFGAPMLADPGYQVGYPFTWLHLIVLPGTFYKLMAVAHGALTALGAFRLARAYGLAAWPAAAAGALWLASGPFLSTLAMNHHFVGAAWMPWVLLAVEGVLKRPGPTSGLRLAVAEGLQLLAGSGDMCLMTALAAALRGVSVLAAKPRRTEGVRILATAGLAALLAFGLGAVQWIPTLALVGESGRARMQAADRGYWSLAPVAALDLLVPRLVSDAPLSASARERWFEGREPFLTSVYVGVVCLPLVALGALSRGPARAFLCLATLLFLALALGRFNPVYGPLARLPPFGLLRYPVKYLVPFALFWSVLAARGLQEWRLDGASRIRRLSPPALAAGVGLLALAAAAWLAAGPPAALAPWLEPLPERWLSFASGAVDALLASGVLALTAAGLLWARLGEARTARIAGAALGLLAVGDAVRAGQPVNPVGPASLTRHLPPVVERLRRAGNDERVWAPGADRPWLIAQLARGPGGWDVEARWTLGLLELLQPPRGARFGVPGSFDGDFTGLAPAPTAELAGLLRRFRSTPVGTRLLELGAVGFVVTLERSAFPQLDEAGPALPSVFREPIHLLRVPRPLPRAYVVSGARVAAEPEAYVQLAEPGFDPWREVVLAPPARETSEVPGFESRVRFVERRLARLALEVEASAPGFLVLVEAYDPGWQAELDGAATPVLRANSLFRAVRVPAGRHRVELRYRPAAALWGAAVSLTAWLAVVALAVASRRRGPP